jgi:hypothetical protein
LEEKELLGRVGTPKKRSNISSGLGIRREKGGVFICTLKKLVDVSRRLVPIVKVSLPVVGEHKNGFNEPKRLSDGLPRPIIAKLDYHWAWGWIGRLRG